MILPSIRLRASLWRRYCWCCKRIQQEKNYIFLCIPRCFRTPSIYDYSLWHKSAVYTLYLLLCDPLPPNKCESKFLYWYYDWGAIFAPTRNSHHNKYRRKYPIKSHIISLALWMAHQINDIDFVRGISYRNSWNLQRRHTVLSIHRSQ